VPKIVSGYEYFLRAIRIHLKLTMGEINKGMLSIMRNLPYRKNKYFEDWVQKDERFTMLPVFTVCVC